MKVTRSLGSICLANCRPVIFYLFQGLGGGSIEFNLKNKKFTSVYNGKKVQVSRDDLFKTQLDKNNPLSELPINHVNLLKNIATPANFMHTLDAYVNLQVIQAENTVFVHDSWGGNILLFGFIESYYKLATAELMKSDPLHKLLVDNLLPYCKNISEILNNIKKNKGNVPLTTIIFLNIKKHPTTGDYFVVNQAPLEHFDSSRIPKDKLMIVPENLNFKIHGISIQKFNNVVLNTRVNRLSLPTDIELEFHSGLLDPQFLEKNEFNQWCIYKKKQDDYYSKKMKNNKNQKNGQGELISKKKKKHHSVAKKRDFLMDNSINPQDSIF